MSDTFERLQKVFQDAFEDDAVEISPETTAADVDAWDSLMHVNLLLAVETEFGIRCSSSEVSSLKDVRELLGLIDQKAG